ncbi:MAG TPA: YihY/virulence factor BrkB family protein [Rhodanobacteraceae bacterium]|nr:YihY/virulence factor BrkB family protein [Rhodanobacteraceae bacterium]
MDDGTESHSVLATTKSVVKGFLADKPFQLAAALSYFTLLSMVPLFLLMTGVAGLVYGREAAREKLLSQVGAMVGQQQADVVRALLSQSGSHHASVISTIVGIVILVIGATTVFGHLQTSLNQIWDVKAVPSRNVIWRLLGSRLLALAIVFGMAFIFLVSMVASAALAGAHGYLSGLFPGAGIIVRVVYALVSLAIISAVIALLFKYVPDAVIDWRDVLVGALITGILFTIGKYGLGVYLAHLRYSSAGAAGSLILLVVWVYYSALILFLGAETTQVYACRYGKGITPRAHAERLQQKAA